jgi:hypothetical protein
MHNKILSGTKKSGGGEGGEEKWVLISSSVFSYSSCQTLSNYFIFIVGSNKILKFPFSLPTLALCFLI